jgi:hypothetical protein
VTVVEKTREQIAAEITALAAEAARLPDHWTEQRADLHRQIDALLDRLD